MFVSKTKDERIENSSFLIFLVCERRSLPLSVTSSHWRNMRLWIHSEEKTSARQREREREGGWERIVRKRERERGWERESDAGLRHGRSSPSPQSGPSAAPAGAAAAAACRKSARFSNLSAEWENKAEKRPYELTSAARSGEFLHLSRFIFPATGLFFRCHALLFRRFYD